MSSVFYFFSAPPTKRLDTRVVFFRCRCTQKIETCSGEIVISLLTYILHSHVRIFYFILRWVVRTTRTIYQTLKHVLVNSINNSNPFFRLKTINEVIYWFSFCFHWKPSIPKESNVGWQIIPSKFCDYVRFVLYLRMLTSCCQKLLSQWKSEMSLC